MLRDMRSRGIRYFSMPSWRQEVSIDREVRRCDGGKNITIYALAKEILQ